MIQSICADKGTPNYKWTPLYYSRVQKHGNQCGGYRQQEVIGTH